MLIIIEMEAVKGGAREVHLACGRKHFGRSQALLAIGRKEEACEALEAAAGHFSLALRRDPGTPGLSEPSLADWVRGAEHEPLHTNGGMPPGYDSDHVFWSGRDGFGRPDLDWPQIFRNLNGAASPPPILESEDPPRRPFFSPPMPNPGTKAGDADGRKKEGDT